jgi:glycosyltransferase involved in cell wall biosynthesis
VSYHGDWPDALRKTEAGLAGRVINRGLAHYVHHVFAAMARSCEVAFCVGEALHRKYGRLARKSVVFANFLHSTADIATPRPPKTSRPYTILFVGGLEEYKGVKYLLKASALLKRQGLPFKLVLVGTGSLQKELQSIAKMEDIEETVEWLGYIQHGEELFRVYREADLFVLPSIASEGTPKVLMEAMSQGVPVLATDVGSSGDLLAHGKYGVVVQPRDVDALADAIRDLCEDAELRRALSSRGIHLAHLSTLERQMTTVKAALEESVPEILGVPGYERARRLAG